MKEEINMRNKSFFLLWTGKLVSSLGDKMYAIAIAWWILDVTNSPIVMGLYLLAATLPMVLLGVIAGAIIDRSNLKHILVIADITRGIGLILIGLLYLGDKLTISNVFLITISISLASAFFNPSVTSIIPHIVSKNECGKANSIIQMVDGIAKVAGPIIGVAVVTSEGYYVAFMINGISFLASAIFEGFIEYEKGHQVKKNKTTLRNTIKNEGVLKDVKVGLQYVYKNSKLMSILFYILVAHFFIGAISVMIPFMAKFISSDNMNLLGILETVLGSGFVVGAFIFSRKSEDKFNVDTLPRIFLLVGYNFLLIGAIAWFDNLPIILFVVPIFVIGYCVVNASINWRTFIQTDTPTEKLGRISSISALVGDITLPLSFALFGFLLDQVNFVILTLISGLLLIMSVLVISFIQTNKKETTESNSY
jgi:MFS family permease